MRFLVGLLAACLLFGVENVEIPSSVDGKPQGAWIYVPPAAKPVPLLVLLHSWSQRHLDSPKNDVALGEAEKRGWAVIAPDFRGANDHPEACASDLAVQDVLDAVDYMKKRTNVDPRRIYVMGGSGGGFMTLVMAGRAPQLWAAASAWVPITDLAAWHAFSKKQNSRYWKMMEACFNGTPADGLAQQEYRRRSPLYFLSLARELPVDIQTGIQDGHTGSVPVSHSLWAFNELAPPARRLSDADIKAIADSATIPAHLARETETEARAKKVLFRRSGGRARVTIFDGGHETDFATGIRWLENHTRPPVTISVALKDNQVLARRGNEAKVTGPPIEGLQSSVNDAPFTAGYPILKTGGPYTIGFRVADKSGKILGSTRRTGILVGDLYILSGQSNMVGRAPLPDKQTEDPRIHMMAPEDVWAVAREPLHEVRVRPDGTRVGAGLGLAFARELVKRTGVPVGLIPCAKGGTSLEQWNPAHKVQRRASLYGNMIARGKEAQGPFRAMLWYQGEADAGAANTASTYLERFVKFVNAVRSDLHQPDLPVLTAQLSRYAVEPKENFLVGWNLVREAQRQAAKKIPHTALVSTLDLTLTDPIHLDAASLQTVGRRMAALVLGDAPPEFQSAGWEKPARLRLRFTRPIAGPVNSQAFRFFNTQGQPIYGAFHAYLDKGDVVLETQGIQQDSLLYHGWGLDPIALPGIPAFGPIKIVAAGP
ncbi:MAG: alpha/beta fold hydrolase [Bryobacterales bacterium]|nr:alpha/beta fold hydrolase [Bryobacterales bacterium]